MENFLEKYSDTDNCPVRNVVARFGNKWSLLILLILSDIEVVRFSDFIKVMPDISSKVLSKELKVLEADGLIDRKAYAVIPPKVEYTLTKRGKSLIPLIVPVVEWAKDNMKPIRNSRNDYKPR
ncbi:MAG: helix-turn-helix transcriptional regulator [Muribaculaceae bacterium]|nr:helix-turn-helix transcriptional regulator [Muribaculaceae bacterium]MDE6804533.1 helix-turn-helix transcriptional regulator [Muribaculaceae bacterium]MDE6844098.1 helix-turn-helix transcriptional regulator [Muribaculaceae bacterium]MDE7190092.1 helix-turn-helix transcriptional regulator [Muribaculaceae bacterium]